MKIYIPDMKYREECALTLYNTEHYKEVRQEMSYE